MRNWITLIERAIAVPSFVERVTDDLLDEVIATGKWVHHGGDVQDQWDGGAFDFGLDGYPKLRDRPFDEVRHTPEFRELLRSTLRDTAEHQYNELVNGSRYNKTEPLSGETKIYRGITGKITGGEVGVYWSQDKHQSLDRFIDQKQGGTLLIAKLEDVQIDWEATIRSRLDLANGQDEQEIQLVSGTPVEALAYSVTFDRGRAAIVFERRINLSA